MRTLATTLVCGGVLGGEISICNNDPNEFVGERGCFIVTFFPIAAVGDADGEPLLFFLAAFEGTSVHCAEPFACGVGSSREILKNSASSSGKNRMLSFALLSFGSSVGEWSFCTFMTSFSCTYGIGEIALVVSLLPIVGKMNAWTVAWDEESPPW